MSEFDQAIVKYASDMGVSNKEAREEAEKLIAQMMREGATREFAEATFVEDTLDTSAEELDKIAAIAKYNGTAKVQGNAVDAHGKKRTVTRKPNEEKRELIEILANSLRNCDNFGDFFAESVNIIKIEREIVFNVGENNYSVVLTCHRNKKKAE